MAEGEGDGSGRDGVTSWAGEAACAFGLAAVGLWLATLASRMPMIEDSVPGPGLAPMILAVSLVALSIGIGVAAVLRREPMRIALLDRDTGTAVALMLGSVLAFEHLGFVAVTFAFLLASFVLIGREPWLRAGLVAVTATAVIWVLFAKALGVQLPAGVLG